MLFLPVAFAELSQGRAAQTTASALDGMQRLAQFRNRGIGSSKETGSWMHAFSEVLTAPPAIEILHVDDAKAA
jgi:hypothetical protein